VKLDPHARRVHPEQLVVRRGRGGEIACPLAARRRDRLDALAERITTAGGRVLVLEVDVVDEAQARDAVARTVAELGRLDTLVNNAALNTRGGIEQTDAAYFDRMMAVNVRAPLLLFKAALPYFRALGGGRKPALGSKPDEGGKPWGRLDWTGPASGDRPQILARSDPEASGDAERGRGEARRGLRAHFRGLLTPFGPSGDCL